MIYYHLQIILGSSSVARRKILSEMGYEFTKMTADIDEKSIRKETPEELVMALAEAKCFVSLSFMEGHAMINYPLILDVIMYQANAIISKLQTTSNQERVDESMILIAADTVHLASFLVIGNCTYHLSFLFLRQKLSQKLPVDDYLKDAEPTLLITCDQETETSQIRIPMGLLGRDCRPINQITTST
ncbi:hypothetical protein HN51_004114 [Arachis hypogaea]